MTAYYNILFTSRIMECIAIPVCVLYLVIVKANIHYAVELGPLTIQIRCINMDVPIGYVIFSDNYVSIWECETIFIEWPTYNYVSIYNLVIVTSYTIVPKSLPELK